MPPSDPQRVLQSVFGYPAFRGLQKSIIEHVVGGGDALVLMPTGGGKSLCYQVSALAREGVGVIVSPLIALMKDQVDSLRQFGVRAAYLNSTLTPDEAREVERQLTGGELELVYIAPERLLGDRCLGLLERAPLALFAIDEAHCISQWGHDFRPDYLGLSVLHQRFPQVPRMALTATADAPTRRDILERLHLEGARQFCAGFDRPNIRYRVVPKNRPRDQLLAFLRGEHVDDAGIVYCLSRKRVEDTAAWLRERGWRAFPYHAGLDPEVRRTHQERFVREEGVVIVATVAFGMGIDKPNVRFVAHLDLPRSVEAYYQETGRAGRDGLPANAWLAYGMPDVTALGQFIDNSGADADRKRLEWSKLNAMLGYCETVECRRQVLLRHFGEAPPEPCGNCDTCLEPVQAWDGTVAAQKALSCVYRTGQRFGVGHLVEVLLGKSTERVSRWNHQRVSTFGIGTELDVAGWRSVYRQLAAAGMLRVDADRFGALRLTAKSRGVLSGGETVKMRRDPSPRRLARRLRKVRRVRTESREESFDHALWERLRALRLDLARSQSVPPYVIFHDATLMEMVRWRPSNLVELARIPGVGARKLERYGEAFLDALRE